MNGTRQSFAAKRIFARARCMLLKRLRRFSRHQKGAAAVEFALVALPFFALMFAIIQTAIVLFATQVLETAVGDSARLILTGQAQDGGFSQTSFKTAVCGRISAMFNCTTRLYVDVRTFTNFTAISMNSPTDSSGNVVDNFVYQPGGPGDIVVVRLLYKWPIYMQLWNPGIVNMSANQRLLVATAAFRNEPF